MHKTQMDKKSEMLDALATAIDEVLEELYCQRMGFALFMFSFGPKGQAGDYVSNGKKPDMIKFMRDVADRLEAGEDVAIPLGSA